MPLPTLVAALLIALAPPALAQAGPYAGQQGRDIKALSERELSDLLAGEGMGLAKAAELNGYPGPAHVVELAVPLALSAEQLERSRRLLAEHNDQARQLGSALVDAERRLDRAFALRAVDDDTVRRLTAEIGRLHGELRAEHLRTHLAQTTLLSAEQVARHAALRGYGGAGDHLPHQRARRHELRHDRQTTARLRPRTRSTVLSRQVLGGPLTAQAPGSERCSSLARRRPTSRALG